MPDLWRLGAAAGVRLRVTQAWVPTAQAYASTMPMLSGTSLSAVRRRAPLASLTDSTTVSSVCACSPRSARIHSIKETCCQYFWTLHRLQQYLRGWRSW